MSERRRGNVLTLGDRVKVSVATPHGTAHYNDVEVVGFDADGVRVYVDSVAGFHTVPWEAIR